MSELVTLSFFRDIGVDIPPISVLDVGVSGGLDTRWRRFGPDLRALGVDPLVAEVKRLKDEEDHPGVNFLACFVEWPEWQTRLEEQGGQTADNSCFERTSAYHAYSSYSEVYTKENYNAGEEVVFSDLKLTLDELVTRTPEARADFIKTDTDGFDFPVLMSGRNTLASDMVLGLAVESNFHGSTNPYANNFANIDMYLRQQGFTLFQITPYQYTRAALPGRFGYPITAQTETGSTQWADTLYFRDFCNPRFEELAGWLPGRDHILRQSMLLEMHGQVDSAVELLVHFQDTLDISDEQLGRLLDALVKRYSDPTLATDYKSLIEKFKSDYRHFFP